MSEREKRIRLMRERERERQRSRIDATERTSVCLCCRAYANMLVCALCLSSVLVFVGAQAEKKRKNQRRVSYVE